MNPGTDVKLVKVGLADMPTALCDKQVDAFVGNEPNSSVAIIQGWAIPGRAVQHPIGTINAGILTSQDAIDNKSKLVQNVVAAQAKAIDEVVADPSLVPAVAETWGADRAATEKSLENLAFAWKIDDTFVSNYQELAVQLKAIGLVTKDVDVKPIVNGTFSKAVAVAALDPPQRQPRSAAVRWGLGGSRLTRVAVGTVLPLIILLLWQFWAPHVFTSFQLPSPAKVVQGATTYIFGPRNGVQYSGTFLADLWASLQRVLGGFLVGALIGVPVGLAVGFSRMAAAFLEPMIGLLRSVPGICWLPLALIWFGSALRPRCS